MYSRQNDKYNFLWNYNYISEACLCPSKLKEKNLWHRESACSDSALNAELSFCKDGSFQETGRIVPIRMSQKCIHTSVLHIDTNS